MDSIITKEHAQEAIDLTADIMKKSYIRLIGTPECKLAADRLKDEYGKYADTSRIEEFDAHPNSFLSFVRIQTLTYILFVLILQFKPEDSVYILIGFILNLFSFLLFGSQFVCYLLIFDFLYKKKQGYNAIGIIEPNEEIHQQIIISGHHDSALRFNFNEWKVPFYGFINAGGSLANIIMFLYSFYFVITRNTSNLDDWLIYFWITCCLLWPFFFYISKEGVPGAGDNLISSSITVILAKLYGKNSSHQLKHTRLIIMSCDGEEIGLRGARAYARRHLDETNKLKLEKNISTYVVVLDGITKLKEVNVLTREINSLQPSSKEMANDLVSISKNLGYKTIKLPIPFGAGSTDAGAFARAGYEACNISTRDLKEAAFHTINTHTSRDTVEKIEPQAVEAIMKIVSNYIRSKDR